MNTTFTRLMWKEYRAQRMLWLVLLLGWLGLHLIYIFNREPLLDVLPVIVMLPVCFLVAAATIAFAGEEDDRTANLLRMLPCHTSTLILSKVTTIIVGCMALCLSMLVLSAGLEFMLWVVNEILMRFNIGTLPFGIRALMWRRSGTNDMPADGEGLYVPAFLALVFASGILASMNARSIFSAVGATVVVVLGIMITAFAITSGVHQYQLGVIAPWIAGLAAIQMVISTVFLSRPWHLGRLPLRLTIPEASGNFFAGRIPSYAWFWHGWLKRIAGQPMTVRRSMGMLTWRECRSAVPFAMTWLTIGTLICAGRFFSNGEYPWPFMFLLVFIHECGQRTMREDQRSGSVLLLANAGIHPLQIWTAKLSTWLLIMCVVGFAVIGIEALVPGTARNGSSHNTETRILNIIDLLRVPEVGQLFGRHDIPSTPADHWLQAGVCLAAVLGLFSLGQLTACWIRRQIIALAASSVVTIAASFLGFYVKMKDWPVWIALVPIPFCFLLATATTARQCFERSVTWRLRIRQTFWLVLPCVVFPCLGLLAWSRQPLFALVSLDRDPGNAGHSLYNLQNPTGTPEVAQLTALARSPWSEWERLDNPDDIKCWLEFAAAVEKFPIHRLMIGQSGYVGVRVSEYKGQGPRLLSQSHYLEKGPDIIRHLLKPFDAELAEKNRFPSIPVMWTAPWSSPPAVPLSVALLEDARHRENNGDIAGAVQQIVRAILANRSLAMQTSSWANWLVCLDAERVALGRLRLILGSADLSTIDLDALFAELKSALVMTQHDGRVVLQWQDPQLMLQRRTLFGTIAIDSKGTFFEKLSSLPHRQRSFESSGNFSNLPDRSAESARAIYTMWLAEALLVEKYRSMTIDGRVRFTDNVPETRILQLKRFMATSNLADLNVDLLVAESDKIANNVSIPHIDTIASERATLLTIMLQQYRITHGKFPDSLLDLPNGDPSNTRIQTDPWTGAPFFYAATGHKSPLKLHFGPTSLGIAPDQPLLFSTGGYGFSLQSYLATPSLSEPTEMYKLPPNVIVFLGLSDVVDWRIGQIATSVTVFPVPVADSPMPVIDWLPGQPGGDKEQ